MIVQLKLDVPFVDLVAQHEPLRGRLLEAVGRVIDHGQFVFGPEVAQLEREWARRCGTQHAISVSDGTAALFLTLQAIGIGAGDEVVTAPNSFVSSASCIALCGAAPRFADVGDDFNVDPISVAAAVTPRTRAIIAVHLTGRPADMNAISQIAQQRDLVVVEDAAQAMGARYANRPVGGLGLAAAFSLHPLKVAGACGDAGMITTNDDELAATLRRLRNHGIINRQEDCRHWGYNARMDTIQAAMTLVKLDHLDTWIQRRRAHTARYRRGLEGVVRMPVDRAADFAVYHTFPIETDRRDELASFLGEQGIGCAIHYRLPIHRLAAAGGLGYRVGDLPVAERQAGRVLSLPMHAALSDEQVEFVCHAIRRFHQC